MLNNDFLLKLNKILLKLLKIIKFTIKIHMALEKHIKITVFLLNIK